MFKQDNIYHEKVFMHSGIVFNNAEYERVCIRCKGPISARSVHQDGIGRILCVETKIHFHKVFKDTGNCYYPNCAYRAPLEEIKKYTAGEEFAYLVRQSDIDALKEGEG